MALDFIVRIQFALRGDGAKERDEEDAEEDWENQDEDFERR